MTQASQGRSSVFEGTLEYIPLADLVQMLRAGGKTGVLFLRREEGQTAVVAFRNGAIIQAVSSATYQSLGERLVGSGAINRIDLHEALHHMTHSPGMRVGDALVDLGRIKRSRIEDEVRAQMTETIEQLMSWTDAEFEFQVGFTSHAHGITLDLVHQKGVEPLHLLLEASLLQDTRNRERQSDRQVLGSSPEAKRREEAR